MTEPTETLVDKLEALQIIAHHIDKPGVMDCTTFEDLVRWQNKICQWLIADCIRERQATQA